MHEDVNKISDKPYVEYKDSNGRSDKEISYEYWSGFKMREKSIFVDLFYGQLKSRVQCTSCDNVSISFDPFNVLSVPIPSVSEFLVRYIPHNLKERPTSFVINVGEYVTIKEIRRKIEEYLIKKTYPDG
jgi:ubiquitin carboxyl-terminal hydrolase 6/32